MNKKTNEEKAAIMQSIAGRAEAIATRVMEEVDLQSLTDSLDKFNSAWGEMMRFIRETEHSENVLYTGAQAVAFCDAANKILDAAFGGGCIGFQCFDDEGEECAWEDAESAQFSADGVSFRLVNKGHYTGMAETLGGDTMQQLANLCHLSTAGGERDGQYEWLYIEWAK